MIINGDTFEELLRAQPDAIDEIQEWDHEQWTTASNTLTLLAKVLRKSGCTNNANGIEAAESAFYAVWEEQVERDTAARYAPGRD